VQSTHRGSQKSSYLPIQLGKVGMIKFDEPLKKHLPNNKTNDFCSHLQLFFRNLKSVFRNLKSVFRNLKSVMQGASCPSVSKKRRKRNLKSAVPPLPSIYGIVQCIYRTVDMIRALPRVPAKGPVKAYRGTLFTKQRLHQQLF
jgi:hypothetical protein